MRQKIKWLEPFALIFMAALVVFTILPWDDVRNPNPKMYWWNLFSFGTNQGNLFAAIIYVIAAFALIRQKKLGSWFCFMRGAGVLYLILIALGSTFLLPRNPDLPSYFFWKNLFLHQIDPLFFVAWWLIKPSHSSISINQSFLWLIGPAIFITYTMIRGFYTSWYPYPILDINKLGTTTVAFYIIGTGIGIVILALLLARVSRSHREAEALY